MIRRVLRPFARRLELGERIGLVEGDHLALPSLPNQLLSAQRSTAQERSQRRFNA